MNEKSANLKGWLFWAGLVLFGALIVTVSPAERTLGNGIKVVYVHVTLTWAGMFAYLVAGTLGLAGLAVGREKLAGWCRTVSWVAWAWFAAGLLMSLWASKVNWGAVHWTEPRFLAGLQFLGVALLLQLAIPHLPSRRLQGLIFALLAFYMMWRILGTPLVLHPESPIRASESLGIKLSFLSLFLLNLVAVARVTFLLRNHRLGRAV